MDGSRGGPAARSNLSPEIGKRVGSQKPQENKAISRRPASSSGRSSENHSEFIPILPAEISAGDGPDSAFRFLGSKTDPILHVSYPSPWNIVADFAAKRGENRKKQNWRRGRDSNPRYLAVHTLSKRAHSATLTPLRKGMGTVDYGPRVRQPNRDGSPEISGGLDLPGPLKLGFGWMGRTYGPVTRK